MKLPHAIYITCLILCNTIFYYFPIAHLRIRKVKYLSQGHKVAQPDFKHHSLLSYLKTKQIYIFSFDAKKIFKEAHGCSITRGTYVHIS